MNKDEGTKQHFIVDKRNRKGGQIVASRKENVVGKKVT